MKLTFIYANQPDLNNAPKYAQYQSTITLPDEIQHLIGINERILGIADVVGQLTQGSLWLTCKQLGFDKQPIITREYDETQRFDWYAKTIEFYFEGRIPRKSRKQRHTFQILGANTPEFPNSVFRRKGNRKQRASLKNNLYPVSYLEKFDTVFYEQIKTVSDQVEFLLNAQPQAQWVLKGINPVWYDYTLFSRSLKRNQQLKKIEEKKAKQAPLKRNGKGKGKVGNTRGYGAIPGIFQGIQFRSQLEIRFATELASRGIDWIYEKERLGQGNYLVDFYLPALKTWVEVKGRFEARDHYLLKDVAQMLEVERDEELFVFTSGKCFRVTSESFESMKRSEFWKLLGDSSLDHTPQ